MLGWRAEIFPNEEEPGRILPLETLVLQAGICQSPPAMGSGLFPLKYQTKTKDYFTSRWKEQEALLLTPESEYFLFLERL